MTSQEVVLNVSIDNQKRSFQIKYLLEKASDNNQQQLVQILNKIYPFTENPIDKPPPLQFIETSEKKMLSKNVIEQLQKYSYIVITGGICVKKRRHQYVENRFLGPGSEEDIFFSLKDPQVELLLMANSSVLRIHNIWIQMAKSKRKAMIQDYIKNKLLKIPFFSNLQFQQFSKCCKKAEVKTLGPGDILLKNRDTPYHMYIVGEGELVFQKRVKIIRDNELWVDFINQLQREEDNVCQQMLLHLVKEPKQKDQTFQIDFRIKSINQGEIICARETLLEEQINYSIMSTLKTKLIAIKYPDLYILNADRLSQMRLWPAFQINDTNLRRDYFYQVLWKKFKEETQKESQLNKMQKQKFEDFLRKQINMNPNKSYYMANKVGQGNIIDNPAGKISKLKSMTYKNEKK